MSRPLEQSHNLSSDFNKDLLSIKYWVSQNGLCLNCDKCYVLPICKKRLNILTLPPLHIGDKPIKFITKVTNLGYVINTSLTCVDHINSIVGKVYYTLRNLRMSASFTPIDIRRKLAIQLILPIICYPELVYSKLDSQSAHKIEVAFNHITRYVFGIAKYEHISAWRKSLLGCEISSYWKARNCIFLYRLMMNKTPSYLYEKLVFSKSTRVSDLIVPSYNYLSSARLFFVNAIRIWNAVPAHIRGTLNKSNFKTLLYSYFR